MTHRISLYIAIVATAVCSLAICTAFSVPQQRVDDTCVLHSPPVIISGFMRGSGRTFTEMQYEYWLTYQGTRKTTGDKCQGTCMVTEKEYERRMYRVE